MMIGIKGMSMPEKCTKCFCCDKNFNNLDGTEVRDWMCLIEMKYINEDDDKRPDWCPMVEITDMRGEA